MFSKQYALKIRNPQGTLNIFFGTAGEHWNLFDFLSFQDIDDQLNYCLSDKKVRGPQWLEWLEDLAYRAVRRSK